MEYKRIIYEPGKVTRIIMNRPQNMNALSHPMYREMEDAFDRAAADEGCKVIVLSGAGRCFSAGNDYVPSSPESMPMVADGRTLPALIEQYGSEAAALRYFRDEHDYFNSKVKLKKWRAIPKPTIAMVHGYCIYGGLFTAAAMDLIFASEDALFLPQTGQFEAGPWWFGERKFKEIMFEHRFITAREAYDCGFVSRIYPNSDILEKETLAYANRCAENDSSTPLRFVKESINLQMDLQGFTNAVAAANTLYINRINWQRAVTTSSGQGKGVAEVPRALANLKAKQESEKL